LLARRPYISLMDALAKVHNEETRLHDASLLQSSTVLATRSSVGRSLTAHPAAPVPLASPLIVPPTARGESVGFHCGRDEYVEAFCYRKKKAQAHHSSQSTSGTGSEDSERSSAGSKKQEILILLHRLVASTSLGAVVFVTQPSALTSSATAS
jgi:hypothetical protein